MLLDFRNLTKNGSTVHAEARNSFGVYPACNPGLIVGVVQGTDALLMGDWKYTESVINCSKCSRIQYKGK